MWSEESDCSMGLDSLGGFSLLVCLSNLLSLSNLSLLVGGL